MSDVSKSGRSPKLSEWVNCSFLWANHSFALFWWATWVIRSWLLISSEQPEQIAHGRSFILSDLSESLSHSFDLSDLSKSLMVAYFLWATWAIRSLSLISSELPDRFAHGRSFVLSDLSESLIRSFDLSEMRKWVMREWAMSKCANSQPWLRWVESTI